MNTIITKNRTSMMGNTATSFALHERAPIPYLNAPLPTVGPFFSAGCYASKTGIRKTGEDVGVYQCADLCDGAANTFFGLQNG